MSERLKEEHKPGEREFGTISYVKDVQNGSRFLQVTFSDREIPEMVNCSERVDSVGIEYRDDIKKPRIIIPDKTSPQWENLSRFVFGDIILRLPKGSNIGIKKYIQGANGYWWKNGSFFISSEGDISVHIPPNQNQVISIHTTFYERDAKS